MSKYPLSRRPWHWPVSLAVIVTSGLCVLSPEGFQFQWWEDHTVHIMLSFLITGVLFFMLNHIRPMIVCFAGCALLCLYLNQQSDAPLRSAGLSEGPTITIGHFGMDQPTEETGLRHESDPDYRS